MYSNEILSEKSKKVKFRSIFKFFVEKLTILKKKLKNKMPKNTKQFRKIENFQKNRKFSEKSKKFRKIRKN